MTKPRGCADHTPAPKGYLQWHEWAEKKAKTHVQIKCPECGRLKIWIPRTKRSRKLPGATS